MRGGRRRKSLRAAIAAAAGLLGREPQHPHRRRLAQAGRNAPPDIAAAGRALGKEDMARLQGRDGRQHGGCLRLGRITGRQRHRQQMVGAGGGEIRRDRHLASGPPDCRDRHRRAAARRPADRGHGNRACRPPDRERQGSGRRGCRAACAAAVRRPRAAAAGAVRAGPRPARGSRRTRPLGPVSGAAAACGAGVPRRSARGSRRRRPFGAGSARRRRSMRSRLTARPPAARRYRRPRAAARPRPPA